MQWHDSCCTSHCSHSSTEKDLGLPGCDAMSTGLLGLMTIEAASPFETSVLTYWSTRRHIPEDFNLRQCHCDNLKSHTVQGSDDGLTEVLFLHLSGATEDNKLQSGRQCPGTDMSQIHVMHQPAQYHFMLPCPSHASWFNHHNNQAKSMNYSTDYYVDFSNPLFLPVSQIKKNFPHHFVFRHNFCWRCIILLGCHTMLLGE